MSLFFTEYNRTFWLWSLLSKFGHNALTLELASWVGNSFSNRKSAQIVVKNNMMRYLQLSDAEAEQNARGWYKNFGYSGLSVFFYKQMNTAWWEKRLAISDEQKNLLQQLQQHGGLMLSFHSHHHHNTLGSFLGIMGCDISPISAAKNPEFDHPTIRQYHIGVIHDDSEKNFGKGRYLYFSDLKTLIHETRKALAQGFVVASAACDYPFAKGKKIPVMFLGQRILAYRWLFDLGIKLNKPLYAGMLTSEFDPSSPYQFSLDLFQLRGNTTEAVCQDYFSHLERIIKNKPYSWQGWEWIDALIDKNHQTVI